MEKQLRAKVGGETGVNGEWYEGGKFLPSTEKPKGKKVHGTGKVQYEPFKWTTAPEGKRPIFKIVGAQAEWIDRYKPELGIKPFAAGLAYFGENHHGVAVTELCERYNRGERWF